MGFQQKACTAGSTSFLEEVNQGEQAERELKKIGKKSVTMKKGKNPSF